ncbi:MAG: hypothetical protein U5Q03_02555 [Bacteroidota bacterium]|nr:hypothetical protein [Bacteroidota bacterium]
MKISKKQLILLGFVNILVIIVISFLINYAYSKLYWQDRVSIRTGEEITNQDTIVEAYVGQSYKIGTAFEVYKKTDPLLKVVSKDHGALELAVSSGNKHFSDLAKFRDAVIRKTGEGNLIFSIPSYTHKNIRSIIIGNESKAFMEFKNSDTLLINMGNFMLDAAGNIQVNDVVLNFHKAGLSTAEVDLDQILEKLKNQKLKQNIKLSDYLQNINQAITNSYQKIDQLEQKFKILGKQQTVLRLAN